MKKAYPKRIQIDDVIYNIAKRSIEIGTDIGFHSDLIAMWISGDVVKVIQNNYRRRRVR
jgi:hypothetical protein